MVTLLLSFYATDQDHGWHLHRHLILEEALAEGVSVIVTFGFLTPAVMAFLEPHRRSDEQRRISLLC